MKVLSSLIITSSFGFLTLTSAFFTATASSGTRKELKTKLLDLANSTKRGLIATPEQKEEILALFEKLEKLNPIQAPLASAKVNGDWSLDYSTSDSIIGKGGFPRVGPIVQKIDTNNLVAENSEIVSYFGVKVPRKVTAELTPENKQFTNVRFRKFTVGPVSFEAPESFRGSLDITYLDDELRLTRGDKGNIFVLTRM